MILLLLIMVPLVATSIYIYFAQILNDHLIWWTIPIGLIVSFVGFILLFLLFIVILNLFFKTKDLKPSQYKHRPFFTYILKELAPLITLLFRVKIIFEGKSKLPKDGPFLLVSNHQSMYDPIALETVLSEYRAFYVYKNNLLKVPVIGKFLINAGFYPLDRENTRKSMETISASIKRIENGEPMFIYPEGTRNLERKLGELHAGTFKIALKAKCPIVILPTDGAGLLHKNYPFKQTTIVFKVSKVLSYEEIKNLSTKQIKEIVEKEFNENIENFREKYPFLKAGLK